MVSSFINLPLGVGQRTWPKWHRVSQSHIGIEALEFRRDLIQRRPCSPDITTAADHCPYSHINHHEISFVQGYKSVDFSFYVRARSFSSFISSLQNDHTLNTRSNYLSIRIPKHNPKVIDYSGPASLGPPTSFHR